MSTAACQERPDFDRLLVERLGAGVRGTVLAGRRARIVLDAVDSGVWTVDLDGTRGRVHRGGAPSRDLLIRADLATLAGVVGGTVSGTEAFLDGRLTVRGDLALSLQLDGLWTSHATDRPESFPRARETAALGVRTAYLEAGPPGGPPVVLLHGLGATNASMLPLLVDLARDYRVLSPDLPGHGASAAPSAAYTAGWFAAWVEAFQVATGSRPATLVGNSLGGRIALEAAMVHPRSVGGLVLLAPSPAFRRLRQFVPLVRLAPPGLASMPLPVSHRLLVEGIRVMFGDPDRLPRPWYDAAADEGRRVMRSRAHRVAFFSCARQIYLEEAHGRAGFWDRLPGVDSPALFLWGERDRLVPAAFARHVADGLPHAESVILPGCGHVPQFERRGEVTALVRDFLGRLTATR